MPGALPVVAASGATGLMILNLIGFRRIKSSASAPNGERKNARAMMMEGARLRCGLPGRSRKPPPPLVPKRAGRIGGKRSRPRSLFFLDRGRRAELREAPVGRVSCWGHVQNRTRRLCLVADVFVCDRAVTLGALTIGRG
jgi:hypothetical protein